MEPSLLGWLGSICFMLCAIPQAWRSIKDGHSHGISWAFLTLWLGGQVFLIIDTFDTLNGYLPLLVNYIINLVSLSVIIYYKLAPRNKGSNYADIIPLYQGRRRGKHRR